MGEESEEGKFLTVCGEMSFWSKVKVGEEGGLYTILFKWVVEYEIMWSDDREVGLWGEVKVGEESDEGKFLTLNFWIQT